MILTALKGISLKVWGAILAGLILLGALLKAYNAGRKAAETDGLKSQIENAQVRHETDAAVDRADPAARRRLRDKWTRPE